MKKLVHVVWGTALLAVALGGCRKLPEIVDERIGVKIDPKLSKTEERFVRGDVQKVLSYSLDVPAGGWFEKIFDGRDGLATVRFLDSRINYILPADSNLRKRVRYARIEDGLAPVRATTVASNIGTAVWLMGKAGSANLAIRVGKLEIPVDSTRSGIIQLGEGYSWEEWKGVKTTPAFRLGTLVHEARHSDCTGGLSAEDLSRIRAGGLPEDRSCGHLHVKCPAGHELAGAAACDGQAWGAYAVGAVYGKAVFNHCDDCTELEKQQALARATDSFTRILVLDDMLAGRLGDPDMSSTSRISLDEIRERIAEFRKARAGEAAEL